VRRPLLVAGLAIACVAVAVVLAIGLANQDTVDDVPAPTGSMPSLEAAPFEPFAAPQAEGEIIAGEGAGGRLSLDSLRGRPVLVNFWASWCDPCKREAPDLVAFAKAHPDVVMLGINSGDARKSAVPFARDLGFAWPSIEDGGGIRDAFKLNGLPGTFIVDRDGRVVFRKLGTVTADELAAAVRDLA
jgi:cytochrome c biogenesis protein CcmG/thiol:disulfide interchange protein DsbE